MPTHKITGHPPKGRRKADGTTPTRNKGILRARRQQKREEAETRNTKTKPERRKRSRISDVRTNEVPRPKGTISGALY